MKWLIDWAIPFSSSKDFFKSFICTNGPYILLRQVFITFIGAIFVKLILYSCNELRANDLFNITLCLILSYIDIIFEPLFAQMKKKTPSSFTKVYSESLQKAMKTRSDLMYLDYSLHCFKFKFTLQILVFQKGFLRAFVGSHASDGENRTRQKYSWSELLHKLMEIFSYIFHVIMKVGYVCHRMHFCQRVRY